MTSTTSFTGSCSCHHIQYTCTVTTPTTITITNCHCTECRKLSGGPYQSWADVPRSCITWTATTGGERGGGEASLTKRRSSSMATRSFCPRCGSSLTMEYDFESDIVGIAAGTIDDRSLSLTTTKKNESELLLKPTAHIWLKEKAVWFKVDEDDGMERFQEHRPQTEELLRKWQNERTIGQ